MDANKHNINMDRFLICALALLAISIFIYLAKPILFIPFIMFLFASEYTEHDKMILKIGSNLLYYCPMLFAFISATIACLSICLKNISTKNRIIGISTIILDLIVILINSLWPLWGYRPGLIE